MNDAHNKTNSDPVFLPYGKQTIDEEDIQAVINVLRSDWLTTGPFVESFEKALSNYCGAKHAIAVSNGTSALHISMLAAKIGPGDRVLTSPNTFLASANCAAYVGAIPDFVDIDNVSYNVCPEKLQAQWCDDVNAVVAVDFAGYPCDMPKIAEIARANRAYIIEDACHAIGGEFNFENQWHKIGGHPWADMTVFSFHPVKTITTGEGGAILTNNDELAERCKMLRNHGMIRNPNLFVNSSEDLSALKDSSAENSIAPWCYEMPELGYNYRLTDIQCALGLSQLKKLDKFVQRRQEIVDIYNAAFSNVNHVITPPDSKSARTSWHLYVLQIDFRSIGKSRLQVVNALEKLGIGTQVHYIPVYLQPYYRKTYGYAPGKCPVAESVYEKSLSLPLYPLMSDDDVNRVIETVTTVIGQ